MATRRMSVFGGLNRPDDGGDVRWEPSDLKKVNDFFKGGIWVYDDSGTDDDVHGRFRIPEDYVGAPKVRVVWTVNATTGNVVWECAYRAVGGDDLESLDQATAQETVSVTDGAPSAAFERMVGEMSLTAGNLAASDSFEFFLRRKGSSASDTLAASALLFDLEFEYSDV